MCVVTSPSAKCKRSCNLCGDLFGDISRTQATRKTTTVSKPRYDYRNRYANDNADNTYVTPQPAAETSTTTTSTSTSTSTSTPRTTTFTTTTVFKTTASKKTSTSTSTPLFDDNDDNDDDDDDDNNDKDDERTSSCDDIVDYCKELAEIGDCQTNEETMRYYCSRSCQFC